MLSALQRPRSLVTKWASAVFKLQHRGAEVSTRIHPWGSDSNIFNLPSIELKGSSVWQSETDYSVEMFPMVTSNQPTPSVQNNSTARMRKETTKDMDTDTERDVFFHHSDPSDSSIHHPPSFFDRGYFLPPNSVSMLLKFHVQIYIQASKVLKGAGNCKVKLSAAFHATAWQNPMVGWMSTIDQVEQNIPLCTLEVNLFPIMVNTYCTCNMQNMWC